MTRFFLRRLPSSLESYTQSTGVRGVMLQGERYFRHSDRIFALLQMPSLRHLKVVIVSDLPPLLTNHIFRPTHPLWIHWNRVPHYHHLSFLYLWMLYRAEQSFAAVSASFLELDSNIGLPSKQFSSGSMPPWVLFSFVYPMAPMLVLSLGYYLILNICPIHHYLLCLTRSPLLLDTYLISPDLLTGFTLICLHARLFLRSTGFDTLESLTTTTLRTKWTERWR